MKKKGFHITVEDISVVGCLIFVSGRANRSRFNGKVGGLTVAWVWEEPVKPRIRKTDHITLSVIRGDVSKIKIGDTLYEED